MKKKYDKKISKRRSKVNKKKVFTLIPIEIMEDHSLKLNEKVIMAEVVTMHFYAGEFNATNQYFADLLNLSKSSVSRIINDLRERGYLHAYQYFDPVDKVTYKRTLHPKTFLRCQVFKSNNKLKVFNEED